MTSRCELEDAICGWLVKTRHAGRTSKYVALVKSAVQLEAQGCDGGMMIEVERAAEERLASLSDESLMRIWEETGNAQPLSREEDSEPSRTAMVQDIVVDLIQLIVARVCEDATDIIKDKKKVRQAVQKERERATAKPAILQDMAAGLAEWPRSWMGVKEDLAYGQGLLEVMRPFAEEMIARGLKKATIRRHLGNLWLLGGEIIRDVDTEEDYSTPPAKKLREAVGPDGGPFCRHLDSEEAYRSYDATGRKLHKFLEADA